MSLKEVLDDYFNGIRTEPKLKVRNLINRPKNLEDVKNQTMGFPIINKILTDYYRSLWEKDNNSKE
ncbi:hypothetical protein R4Z10_08750 [Niallia sp. XMNu-256]|uniref:hypothetical protein n=1 Tax=Niallia sp. XMNu-256 TaxID=3082444 RepID=UPI0030CF1C0E